MNKIVLIDVKNLAFRAHYAFKALQTEKKEPTSVLHGFPSLFMDVQKYIGRADYVFVWDGAKPYPNPPAFAPSWRKKIHPTYKENRKPNPDRTLTTAQLPALSYFLDLLGYLQIGVNALEADDLIGIGATALAAREKVRDVWVYSNDTDLFQLVGGKIRVVAPTGKGGVLEVTPSVVEERLGVKPEQVHLLKAIAGDSTDCYKPIAGVGDVSARKMLEGGIDPRLPRFADHPPEVQEFYASKGLPQAWKEIQKGLKLSTIPRSADYPLLPKAMKKPIEDAILLLRKNRTRRMSPEDLDITTKKFIEFCNRYELNSLIAKRRAFFEFVVDS